MSIHSINRTHARKNLQQLKSIRDDLVRRSTGFSIAINIANERENSKELRRLTRNQDKLSGQIIALNETLEYLEQQFQSNFND